MVSIAKDTVIEKLMLIMWIYKFIVDSGQSNAHAGLYLLQSWTYFNEFYGCIAIALY